MFTRPDDLSDEQVAAALVRGWGVAALKLTYAAIGFGSHHWHVSSASGRWFATVDNLEMKRFSDDEALKQVGHRLDVALGTARALRDHGLRFVAAPERCQNQELLVPIDDRYVMALYPYIVGETYEWGPYATRGHRRAVTDRLLAVHGVTGEIGATPLTDRFEIPRRAELETALTSRESSWGPGPYAARASELLAKHAGSLAAALGRYDSMALDVASRPERFVVTHGEPHRANTISTDDGVVVIDWDTTLLAPAERDLWMLADEDQTIADYYATRSGRDIDWIAVALYRLRWDLCEVALFSHDFRLPHVESDDMAAAWEGLTRHLDPRRWI